MHHPRNLVYNGGEKSDLLVSGFVQFTVSSVLLSDFHSLAKK